MKLRDKLKDENHCRVSVSFKETLNLLISSRLGKDVKEDASNKNDECPCFFVGVEPTTSLPTTSSDALLLSYRRLVSGDSGILGKNPSAPLHQSNLRLAFRLLVRMLSH